jgi:SAM-dependent methyltransferase
MKYDWKDAGEEWSEPWGTSAAQWSGAILPRIRDCLPTETILEVGPGYGRWTHYLKDYCKRLLIVDRARGCIEACRRRFADDPRISCYVNEGGSLSMVPAESIDFVFSFDVFVHIKRDVVETYLREFGTKLKIGGKGFIHHSNLGYYANPLREKLPGPVRNFLTRVNVLGDDRHRTPTMTAELFRNLCTKHGLHCVKQEIVNWRGRRLIDCLSSFERVDSKEQAPTRILRNPGFMREAAAIRRAAGVDS